MSPFLHTSKILENIFGPERQTVHLCLFDFPWARLSRASPVGTLATWQSTRVFVRVCLCACARECASHEAEPAVLV